MKEHTYEVIISPEHKKNPALVSYLKNLSAEICDEVAFIVLEGRDAYKRVEDELSKYKCKLRFRGEK